MKYWKLSFAIAIWYLWLFVFTTYYIQKREMVNTNLGKIEIMRGQVAQ
jgi:hypothetical protein